MRVQRSARWYVLGDASPAITEIWLAVHGYGQLARDFITAFTPIAEPHRLIVAPEALSRFYVQRRPRAPDGENPVGAAWMTREDREAEIVDYVDYLDAVVNRAFAESPNAKRLVALGFSQGTATVSRWAALGHRLPDRLILWGGGPAPELTPGTCDRISAGRLEVVHGLDDQVVPFAVVESSLTPLRSAGVRVHVRRHEGGHAVEAATLAAIAAPTNEAGEELR